MGKLLIATDFSSDSEKIIHRGVALAKLQGDTVYLLHVELPNEKIVSIDNDTIENEYPEEIKKLHAMAQNIRSQGLDAHAIFMTGMTGDAIIKEANTIKADTIVIGKSQNLIKSSLWGSIHQHIVRNTTVPVLIVPH